MKPIARNDLCITMICDTYASCMTTRIRALGDSLGHPTSWLNCNKIDRCRSLLHDKDSSAFLRSDSDQRHLVIAVKSESVIGFAGIRRGVAKCAILVAVPAWQF